jgi:hypothetical protein
LIRSTNEKERAMESENARTAERPSDLRMERGGPAWQWEYPNWIVHNPRITLQKIAGDVWFIPSAYGDFRSPYCDRRGANPHFVVEIGNSLEQLTAALGDRSPKLGPRWEAPIFQAMKVGTSIGRLAASIAVELEAQGRLEPEPRQGDKYGEL